MTEHPPEGLFSQIRFNLTPLTFDVRVATAATEPGENYPALVAADWVPDRVAWLVSSRFGAFAFLSTDLDENLHRAAQDAARAAFRDARFNSSVAVTPIHLHDDGTVEDWPPPTPDAPEGCPPGWFAEVTAVLSTHDRVVRARIDSSFAESEREREQVARRLLRGLLRKDLTPRIAKPLTLRLYGAGDPDSERARVVVKRQRETVARLHLSSRVLTVADELERLSIAQFLAAHGYESLEPLDGWEQPPAFISAVTWIASWGAWKLAPGTDPYDPVAALYFPSGGQLMSTTQTWEPHLRKVLAWHGLRVDATIGYEAPEGHDPLLYTRLEMDLRDTSAARLKYSADSAARAHARNPRILKPSCTKLVPAPVVDALKERLEANPYDHFIAQPGGYSEWTHRSGIFSREQADQLTATVPEVALPDAASDAVEYAKAISLNHLPLLAASRLKNIAPAWWDTLVWHGGSPSPRAGTRRSEVLRNDFAEVRSMNPAQIEQCGQREAVAFLREPGAPDPDLPYSHRRNLGDKVRLFVVASALLRHGLVDDRFSTPWFRVCLICQRKFPADSLTLPILMFTHSDRYCSSCAYEASGGSGALWTSRRAAGVRSAISELSVINGGPPSRPLLAAPLRGLSTSERTTAMMLRQVLPPEGVGPPVPTWGDLLADAGVLGQGWRPSYGTYSTAEDGHPCRSLLERYIDDFMFNRRIPHELEPPYPYDAELNSTGLRADWLVEGVYVEAAGLMSKPEYRRKIETKLALAERVGLEILILTDSDLTDLAGPFARWLPKAGQPLD